MDLKFIPPSVELEPYIYDYVVVNNLNSAREFNCDKFIPGLGGGMVFHFLTSPKVIIDNAPVSLPDYFLFGPQNQYLDMVQGAKVDCLYVKFKLMGLSLCLGLKPAELSNFKFIDMNQVFGSFFGQVVSRMRDEVIPENRIVHLEDFLRTMLGRQVKKHSSCIVENALNQIIAKKGCERLNTLCQYYSADERTLRRQFNNKLGISPKSFSRLVRVNNIIKDIVKQQPKNFSDLVYSYNYFDQAHLINDFKDIVGETPMSLLHKDEYFLRFITAPE